MICGLLVACVGGVRSWSARGQVDEWGVGMRILASYDDEY
jgi:hypothetical protein